MGRRSSATQSYISQLSPARASSRRREEVFYWPCSFGLTSLQLGFQARAVGLWCAPRMRSLRRPFDEAPGIHPFSEMRSRKMATDKVRLASIGLGWWGGVLVEALGRSGCGRGGDGFRAQRGRPQGVFRKTRLPDGEQPGRGLERPRGGGRHRRDAPFHAPGHDYCGRIGGQARFCRKAAHPHCR